MVHIAGIIVLVIYTASIVAVTVYCLMQFHLLYYYKRFGKSAVNKLQKNEESELLPYVTIQLPIFNELYVIKRLLSSISQLDYPKERFEIQVLDDSTDETLDIVKKEVEKYSSLGFTIFHKTRENRTGFKAGALKEGMLTASGEFIAIFDADFVPQPDFLKKTIGYFKNKNVGVVQTRWEHINQNHSILTEVQAFQLNVHFTVEQLGRMAGNMLLQFNGTAGVWRKECIDNAGGWEADTLTEDLDLSYRAQLKGWEIVYLEDTVSPAELPSEMHGLKSQQYRWMKGGAETAKKVLPKVWQSELSFTQKAHASIHLLGSTVFLAVFTLGVFSVPLAFLINPLNISSDRFAIFLISLLSILIIYYIANVEVAWKSKNRLKLIFKFLCLFPIFLSLSMGLSFHNSLAVIQGYWGKKTAFVRTPKFGIKNISDQYIKKKYFKTSISSITIIEGLLFLYFSYSLYYGLNTGQYYFAPMHLLLAIGYGLIFYFSVKNYRFN